MQDHPIPQAVTSYEFHLIGNMTLKQFLELAGGIVVGVVIYQTNLPVIVKWPFIVFFVALGAMIAFVPYEGRPLDQWFFALFRAIYKPTQFYWRKSGDLPDFLTYTKKETTSIKEDVDLSPYKQQRIFEYIHTLPAEGPVDPITYQEMQRVSSVLSLFDTVQVEKVEIVEQVTKPNLTLTPHSLQQYDELFAQPVENPVSVPATPVPEELQINSQIPENIPPIIEVTPEPVVETSQPESSTTVAVFSAQPTAITAQQNIQGNAANIQTSTTLPFPQKPTKPNLVVGMVFDQAGNIVENAIVEISDSEGMPARAVRTNKIGQFFISTPLKNGEYYMKVDKEGILFPTQKLILNNTILDPVEIRATS